MHKIMIVDDEENILKALNRSLRREADWEIECYSNAEDALRRARSCIFDAVISDCNMPGCNGIDFLAELRELQPAAWAAALGDRGTPQTPKLPQYGS